MFGFFRNRRRRKLLAEPMPRHQEVVLERNVAHYALLTADQRAKMRDISRVLVAEKAWVGCGGLHVTDEMKLTLSAQTSLLLLGVTDHDYFRRVESILVYPDVFRSPNPEDGYEDDDLSEDEHGGQAWYRGPVIVNWKEALHEAQNPDLGYNVVIHEFAHQLDFLDGETNGTPPLGSKAEEERWQFVMTRAFERHKLELKLGTETFFSEQAGDDEAEFFADAAEAFYCRPHDLHGEDEDVFAVLAGYFNLDPRGWFTR
jgi:Mlc titration factor MtfA (ptsG expression regulator)